MATAATADRPAPCPSFSAGAAGAALSGAQRLSLEVFGYVVVERMFDPAWIARLRAELYALEARALRGEALPAGMKLAETKRDYFRIDNLAHGGGMFLDYFTDERMTAMVREAIGHHPRITQTDGHIRRSGSNTYRHYFHRDRNLDIQYTAHGLHYFPYVKTITLLDDCLEDDGGTCVIPGSHRLGPEVDPEDVVAAAEADPRRLIHQVVAPAGSMLLFYESLLHTSGINRSGRDRPILIAGYIGAGRPTDPNFGMPQEFAHLVNPRVRHLVTGFPSDSPQASRCPVPFPARVPLAAISTAPVLGDAADPLMVGDKRIVRAAFGIDERTVDVLHLLRRIANGEPLLISWLNAGDPAPQVFKHIYIEWLDRAGGRHRARYDEGEIIRLTDLGGGTHALG